MNKLTDILKSLKDKGMTYYRLSQVLNPGLLSPTVIQIECSLWFSICEEKYLLHCSKIVACDDNYVTVDRSGYPINRCLLRVLIKEPGCYAGQWSELDIGEYPEEAEEFISLAKDILETFRN